MSNLYSTYTTWGFVTGILARWFLADEWCFQETSDGPFRNMKPMSSRKPQVIDIFRRHFSLCLPSPRWFLQPIGQKIRYLALEGSMVRFCISLKPPHDIVVSQSSLSRRRSLTRCGNLSFPGRMRGDWFRCLWFAFIFLWNQGTPFWYTLLSCLLLNGSFLSSCIFHFLQSLSPELCTGVSRSNSSLIRPINFSLKLARTSAEALFLSTERASEN